MVHAYWHVGRELVEVEQHGKARADYGERLIANLATRLSERFGRGMGVATLRRIRRFNLTYPTGTAMPNDVSGLGFWSEPWAAVILLTWRSKTEEHPHETVP